MPKGSSTSRWLLAGLLALLTGCASTIPEPIRQAPPDAPTLEEARTAPEEHRGETVRWGGTLLAVDNRAEGARLEILARPLESGGRPEEEGASPGRFLADLEGVADPAVFVVGGAITVVGRLDGLVQGRIGEYTYDYPRAVVDHHHLWQPRVQRPDPVWCDPWYDPWYDPYYPRPWPHRRYPCW
ncbi:MAG: Slp family lipoprotein [Thiohalospira sp.]